MKNSNLGRGLSFGYTTPELLSGFKTITRRCWKEKYANYFFDLLHSYKMSYFIDIVLTNIKKLSFHVC